MTLESKVLTRYYYVCDICDRASTSGISPYAAKRMAKIEGWLFDECHNGLEVVRTNVCPQCKADYLREVVDDS